MGDDQGDNGSKPPNGKRPGEKDGKWAGSAQAESKHEVKGSEQRVGIGDKALKPDAGKGDKPAGPKTEVAIKPLYKKQFYDKSQASNKEGDDDKTFATALSAKVSVEALGASYDVKAKSAKVTVANAKVEATAAHAQVDLVGLISELFFGKTPKPEPPPSAVTLAPFAARFLDKTTHGVPLAPGPGSPDVLIGGLPAWRGMIDVHACTAPGAAPHGAGPAAVGEPTVLINDMPAIRMGDWVTEPNGGPNVIVEGCPTVMIGSAAPPPSAAAPASEEADDEPWVIFESVAKGDVGAAKAEAKLEGKVDLSKGKGAASFELGASAAAVKAELPLKVRLRVPFTSYYLGLGVTGEGTLGSVGAEASGSVKVNEGDKLFAVSGGLGAHAGVGGLSGKFTIDVGGK